MAFNGFELNKSWFDADFRLSWGDFRLIFDDFDLIQCIKWLTLGSIALKATESLLVTVLHIFLSGSTVGPIIRSVSMIQKSCYFYYHFCVYFSLHSITMSLMFIQCACSEHRNSCKSTSLSFHEKKSFLLIFLTFIYYYLYSFHFLFISLYSNWHFFKYFYGHFFHNWITINWINFLSFIFSSFIIMNDVKEFVFYRIEFLK